MFETSPDFAQATYVDAPPVPNAPATPDTQLFLRSIAFGIGGALLGAVLYGGFIALTHINIGYLAIAVAYFIAKAMTVGSRGQGGRYYQITALVLTYLSVSAANAGVVWWNVRKEIGPIHLSPYNLFVLGKAGLEYPFLRFQDSGASALIGLFILFIGLRAAWRMTSGMPGAVRHPFAR